MRIYLPATTVSLRSLLTAGVLADPPLTGFAVTPGLREYYVDDDIEELEYAASAQAALASLRLLAADPTLARRRLVIAADVQDAAVEVRDDLDIGVVRVQVPVSLAWCASVHCDDADAEATVAQAAELIDAADLGDAEAEEKVDDASGFELCWYATQEIGQLLTELGGSSSGAPRDL